MPVRFDSVCVCVCVCVRERERERERGRERESVDFPCAHDNRYCFTRYARLRVCKQSAEVAQGLGLSAGSIR